MDKCKLRIYNVLWESINGGPSPCGNKRTELFVAGCRIAEEGNFCEGCFNSDLWSRHVYNAECTPEEIVENIKRFAPNRYITIVGGEPLDQIHALTGTCKLLKEAGFHIIVFTHYTMDEIKNELSVQDKAYLELLKHIHILVDGMYEKDKHIYDDNIKDGFHNAIGSGNQVVWDLNQQVPIGIAAEKLDGISLNEQDELCYQLKKEVIAL